MFCRALDQGAPTLTAAAFVKAAGGFELARTDIGGLSGDARKRHLVRTNSAYVLFLDSAGREYRRLIVRGNSSALATRDRKAQLQTILDAMAAVRANPGEALTGTPLLQRLLTDSDAQVQVEAVATLGRAPHSVRSALPLVRKLLTAPVGSAELLSETLRSLRSMGPAAAAAVPELTALLRNTERSVKHRGAAGAALVAVAPKSPATLDALISQLWNVRDDAGRVAATVGLMSLKTAAAPAVPTLVQILEERAPGGGTRADRLATYAVLVLASLGPKADAALPILREFAAREPVKSIRGQSTWDPGKAARAALPLIAR